jgi:3-oxoacyl-[acyl-carrier protein] reductase
MACSTSPATLSAYVTGATLTIDGGNSIGSLAVHQDKKNPL